MQSSSKAVSTMKRKKKCACKYRIVVGEPYDCSAQTHELTFYLFSSYRLLRQRDDCGCNVDCLHCQYGFVSSSCSGESLDCSPCQGCRQEERFLRRKCLDQAEWNQPSDPAKVAGKKLGNIESPTKLRGECEARITLTRKERRRFTRKVEAERQRIRTKKARELSPALKKHVGVTHVAELFNNKDLENMWKEVLKDETVEKKELTNALWEESRYQANVAMKSGKQACRYSDVMMQMAIQMKIKLGNGRFAFVSQAVPGIPSLRKVQEAMSNVATPSTAVNGGILPANMADMRDSFNAA